MVHADKLDDLGTGLLRWVGRVVGSIAPTSKRSGPVNAVSALVLFAVAEIWQRGVELRQEQELTV